jgi:hypothetical protein
MYHQETDQLTGTNLQIDSDTSTHISGAGKWAKFIAIVAFCACGIGLMVALFGATFFERAFAQFLPGAFRFAGAGTGIFILLLFIVIGVMVYIYYLLYNFGQKAPAAVEQGDHNLLAKSLQSLKIYFIISTVLAMLSLLLTLMTMANTII